MICWMSAKNFPAFWRSWFWWKVAQFTLVHLPGLCLITLRWDCIVLMMKSPPDFFMRCVATDAGEDADRQQAKQNVEKLLAAVPGIVNTWDAKEVRCQCSWITEGLWCCGFVDSGAAWILDPKKKQTSFQSSDCSDPLHGHLVGAPLLAAAKWPNVLAKCPWCIESLPHFVFV